MAACFAAKGFTVVGADTSEATVESIVAARAPVPEPGLAQLIADTTGRLSATTDVASAVLNSDVTFVVVPTPSTPAGGFSLEAISKAITRVAEGIRQKNSYHLVVITSTVLPGSTRNSIQPLLEVEAGKRCGQAMGLCYSPEFIALGTVIRDFLNPDLLLIGESDPTAGDLLEEIYSRTVDNSPVVSRTTFANAELAKLAINTFVTTKISFANLLAEICEQLPGADVDAVTRAVGSDSRIGPKYLKGALGYGGPCFPRDNRALSHVAEELGITAHIPAATDAVNSAIPARVARVIENNWPPPANVLVLGASYKPESTVLEASQPLQVASLLSARGYRVTIHDPAVVVSGIYSDSSTIRITDAPTSAFAEADVIVLAHPSRAHLDRLSEARVGALIIDPWRAVDSGGFQTVSLGRFLDASSD